MKDNNFVRIVHSHGNFTELLKVNHLGTIEHNAFTIARSKIGTNDLLLGLSNFDVLNNMQINDDDQFCTAIITRANINFYFDALPDYPIHKEPTVYPLTYGDILIYTGIKPSKIEIDKNFDNLMEKPYEIFKFLMKPKQNKGSGKNKYIAYVDLIDRYQIEVFANSEEEARKIAIDVGEGSLLNWDHMYDNINKDKILEYNTQQTRYSMWHPNDVKIKQIE